VRATPAILILVLATACHSAGPGTLADLRDPQAVAAFVGQNPSALGTPVPLLAITATNGNVLRILDPQADLPVRGPALFSALSVPTISRPTSVAASPLYDLASDVLLVASGTTYVQLVDTWSTTPGVYGVANTWDLSPIVGSGCQILSMAGLSVPSATVSGQPPVWQPTPGVARVVVGLSAPSVTQGTNPGWLVVLDFARAPDGSIYLADRPTAKPLAFRPLSIAASPDHVHVYVASRDAVGSSSSGAPIYGIAEVDARAADASTWPARAFDGHGPTASVAAAILGERTQLSPIDFGPPQLRVYAAIDAAKCGPTQPVACGIATFDPATGGLAADPSPPPSPIGPKVPNPPYRSPLYAPAFPLHLAVGLPAVSGPTQCTGPFTCPPGDNDQGVPQPLQIIVSAVGAQWTTAAGAAPSSDGFVYLEDLGRFGPVDNSVLLDNDLSRTAVIAALSVPATSYPNGPYLGLFYPPGLGDAADPGAVAAADVADLLNSIIVWPGFTTNDTWTLVYQGVLPGLSFLRGSLGRLATGEVYLAVEEALNPLAAPSGSADYWVVGAYVAAPDLAIHTADVFPAEGGDITQFFLDVDPTGCAGIPPQTVEVYEARIASFLSPDPTYFPGGALELTIAPGSIAECLVNRLPLSPGAFVPVSMSVRASGLVLTSAAVGYAGRPEVGRRYNLAWDPVADGPPSEAQVLARKARRLFYPGGPYSDQYLGGPCPGATACYQGYPEMTDPMQPGPVVGFRPALLCTVNSVVAECPAGTVPPRDAYIYFQTQSGMTPLANRPADVATPTAVVSFDKSVFTDSTSQGLGQVFYSTFTGDTLFMTPTSQVGSSTTIR